jgi:hypothetical protein
MLCRHCLRQHNLNGWYCSARCRNAAKRAKRVLPSVVKPDLRYTQGRRPLNETPEAEKRLRASLGFAVGFMGEGE